MITHYWRKALSAFLCAVLILSMFSVSALAEDSVSEEPAVETSPLPATEDDAEEPESAAEETEENAFFAEETIVPEDEAESAEEELPEETSSPSDEPLTDEADQVSELISSTSTHVNPDRDDSAAGAEDVYLDSEPESDAENYFTTTEEAASAVRAQMKARSASFVFSYITSEDLTNEYISSLFKEIMELARAHTGDPREGDYLLWQCYHYSYNCSYIIKDGLYYLNFDCAFFYYTNAQQEAAVDAKVESVLRELNVTGLSDYAKIKAVYDYICSNVEYDYSTTSDLRYSAYAALVNGKSVCQGYALLLYRLALELGLDCRIIGGTSNGVEHRWNIVEVNGKFYLLDPTYDAGEADYDFFLISDNKLNDRTRNSEYDASDFRSAYPVAEKDFVLDAASSSDINWDSITWSNTNGELTVSGTGAIPDCESTAQTPWASESFTSIVVTGSLTAVGTNNFGGGNILQATVGQNIKTVGEKAFAGCTDLGSIYIMNDSCEIFDAADTLGDPETTVIYGYYTSTARDYANKYGYEFENMGFSNRTIELDVTTTNSAEEPVVRIYNASATDLVIYEDVVREESEIEEHAVVSVSEETLRGDGMYAREVALQDVEPGRYKLAVCIPGDYVIRVEYISVSADVELGDRHMWMYGDVDDNGVLDVRDATQIYRQCSDMASIFGSTASSDTEQMRLKAADVDSDGLYTENDAQRVLDYIIFHSASIIM